MGRALTWLSSATWVVPTRWGYPAFLNFISMPTSVLPTTSLAAGCLAFSANRLPRLVGLRSVQPMILISDRWKRHRVDHGEFWLAPSAWLLSREDTYFGSCRILPPEANCIY